MANAKEGTKERTKDSMMYLYKEDKLNGPKQVSIEDIQVSTKQQVMHAFKECRRSKNITQVELSNITGIPQPNVTRFENSKSNPTLEMMIKMAAAMGMELEITLKESGKKYIQ